MEFIIYVISASIVAFVAGHAIGYTVGYRESNKVHKPFMDHYWKLTGGDK